MRMRMKIDGSVRLLCLWALVALVLVAGPAEAATYYVSESSGDDAWSGLAPARAGTNGPWKTLARVSSVEYAPGDRILLKCGDRWNEELRPKGCGTPEKPITIASYGKGAKPVIDRQDDRNDLCGIHLLDQGGFRIAGIEFNRCMTGIYAEYSDGCPTQRFLRIENCYFHDSLLYQHYEDYPKRKIGLGVCLFSHERDNRIVLADILVKECIFRRLAFGFWTNSPDNFNKHAVCGAARSISTTRPSTCCLRPATTILPPRTSTPITVSAWLPSGRPSRSAIDQTLPAGACGCAEISSASCRHRGDPVSDRGARPGA